ncbi:hypothetical protein PIB30_104362, partial [Stylosanthes scabra]|nr:hypothetical protein [Stylosanthes scabra]
RKRKGKVVSSSSEVPKFKTPYHEAHYKSKLSARKANKDYRLEHVLEDLCIEGADWVCHKDGRPHYLRRADLEPMTKGWYDFICRSILPTTNRSELTVERAVLIHSIIIGENINVDEIIANQIYKFVYKIDLSSNLPFPSIIAALCADAKVPAIKDDTLIPQEPPIMGVAMTRTRETRARNPRQARQEAPQQQQPPPQVQPQHQQDFPPNFYTHFNASMSQIYRRLDSQQEESRKSFEAINQRMDRMDDQLSFLCYSNQMVNETMHREEEMNQERIRHDQMVQEATAERAREANKGKAREVVPDSEEEEDSEELASSASEECAIVQGKRLGLVNLRSALSLDNLSQLVRDCRLNTYSKEPPCNRAFKVKEKPLINEIKGMINTDWRGSK